MKAPHQSLRTAAVLTMLLGLPSVVAWETLDAAGDAAIVAYPTGTSVGPAPADSHGGIDIVRFAIEENLPSDAIDFVVTTLDAPAIPRETIVDRPIHRISFVIDRQAFEIEAFVDATSTPVSAAVFVRLADVPDVPIENRTLLWLPSVPLVDDGRTLRVQVPRLLLAEHATVMPGTVMHDVQLFSKKLEPLGAGGDESAFEVLVGPRIEDYAPESPTTVEISYGATYTNDLLIWSPSMIRASNGGAMTIVFPMQLFSSHEETTISIDSIPPTWHVSIPIDRFDGPVDGLVVPVIVTAKFVHAHGKMDFLTVNARGDGETSTAPIGIDYLDVPQPTGHHSTVWLHSTESGAENPFAPVFGALERMVMNTLPDDPRGRDAPIAGELTSASPLLQTEAERRWRWEVPLDPPMRIGVDPIRNESVRLDLDATLPQAGEVDWTAELVWRTADDAVMYDGQITRQHAAGRDGFSMELAPTRDAVKRPGGDHQNLVLVVEASGRFGTWTSNEEAGLFGGTAMDLPFHEYSDSVLGVLPPSDISFGLETWSNIVPPGGELSRTLRVTNGGDEPKMVRLQAQGVDPVTISITPTEIAIAPNETRSVDARAIVPEGAPRQSFNAIVAVSDVGDVAILQWEITADPDAASQPDVKAEGKDSPGLALVPVLALLALASRQMQKRR